MKKTLAFCAILISFNSFALQVGPYRIVGRILAFDEKAVTVESSENVVEIPRDLVGSKKLKTNEALVVTLLPENESKLKFRKLDKKR